MVLLEKTGKSFHEVLRAYKDVKGTGELSARSMWWTCLTLRGIGRRECGVGVSRCGSSGFPKSVRHLDLRQKVDVASVPSGIFAGHREVGYGLSPPATRSSLLNTHTDSPQKTSFSSCTNPSGTPTRSPTMSENRSSSTPQRWATGSSWLRRVGRCSTNRRTRCGRGSQRGENGLA
jgi:hypothetical protein